MAKQIKLVVVTPERLVFEQMVDDVELPGRGGELGVLAEHALLLSMLDTGVLTYHRDGRREMIAVSGGYVEVRPDCVTVLAETAETPEEIDIERARLAREYALKELRASAEEIDFMRARAKLQKAVVRLYVATGGEEGERP
ncbi:MAG: F0F1 ATP synthase subunit epsilon [Acidobacteria bacterium]|nr:MAG: F0F1 ATP synthase subunit epsilon [Acidobacteriota bacterium]